MNKQLTYFDFFSGIGGFKLGLERAGFKCVGYCDNDEYANKLYRNYRIRRLTPLECFRLQGFPDEMVKTARTLGMADCHLYKMAGNAVTVNVIEAVAKKLVEVINGTT